MKKIILMTALMCATALAALNGSMFWDDLGEACEYTANGDVRCIDFSFKSNVPIKFEENVFCYSNESSGLNWTINGCYSTVSLTKAETFELTYVIANDSGKEYEYVNKTYLPMNYSAIISPNAMNLENCQMSYNDVMLLYVFECPYTGKTINADLSPGIYDSLIIAAFQGGVQLTTELIVYIVLGAIIILLIYSVTRKKK